MRGAKPSSGLVHLHKSSVELHFGDRALPAAVSVQAVINGKPFGILLPGQVCMHHRYSTGQDRTAQAPSVLLMQLHHRSLLQRLDASMAAVAAPKQQTHHPVCVHVCLLQPRHPAGVGHQQSGPILAAGAAVCVQGAQGAYCDTGGHVLWGCSQHRDCQHLQRGTV